MSSVTIFVRRLASYSTFAYGSSIINFATNSGSDSLILVIYTFGLKRFFIISDNDRLSSILRTFFWRIALALRMQRRQKRIDYIINLLINIDN